MMARIGGTSDRKENRTLETKNRTCVITQNAIQYLLLLCLAFGGVGVMVWFYLKFIVRLFGG